MTHPMGISAIILRKFTLSLCNNSKTCRPCWHKESRVDKQPQGLSTNEIQRYFGREAQFFRRNAPEVIP
jgi:hypothetical protein